MDPKKFLFGPTTAEKDECHRQQISEGGGSDILNKVAMHTNSPVGILLLSFSSWCYMLQNCVVAVTVRTKPPPLGTRLINQILSRSQVRVLNIIL